MRQFTEKEKKENATKTVVVGMSGGVDSSVAAARLTGDEHDVIGLSMHQYDQMNGQYES